MSATNFTPIQLYRSTTAAAVPLAASLAAGELAINIVDGKLYYNDSGTVKLLASNAATTNVSTISFGTTGLTPSTATSGAITVAGTLAVANGGSGLTSFTAGQIHFGSFSTSANLFFDVTNTRLGVGTNTPAVTASFVGTDAMLIPKGNTAARPSPASGMLRFNTQTTEFEGYNGTAWASVGGAALVNDTSTASDLFPLFASATSGTASSLFTSNAQYLFKPSTGELSVKVPRASNGIVVNSATVSSNYTIATGDNGMSAGPVTINSGITVTVSSGSVYTVI